VAVFRRGFADELIRITPTRIASYGVNAPGGDLRAYNARDLEATKSLTRPPISTVAKAASTLPGTPWSASRMDSRLDSLPRPWLTRSVVLGAADSRA
jgi:hypothetical protein